MLGGQVIGEVWLGGGDSVVRELRIHVDPAAGGPKSGTIALAFQAASALQGGYTDDVTLSFVAPSPGLPPQKGALPVRLCAAGCDLIYQIRTTAGPDVLPGSVVRYAIEVRLEYDYRRASPDPRLLRLELEGEAAGPVAPTWSILAGVLALIGGIAFAPRIHTWLPADRRRWPPLALLALAVALIGWVVIAGAVLVRSIADVLRVAVLVRLIGPWSVALLAALSWGLARGLRRWPADGGWLLGLAAAAMVGLGSLWLAFRLTLEAVVQPVALAVPFVVLGGLGGVVIGQAWRTDPRAGHDRWWAATAVLAHGIVIAGFGYLAEQSLFDWFPSAPTSLLALIPAALVCWAFHRWLGGRQGWLTVLDAAIAGVGLLGLWLWFSMALGFSEIPRGIGTGDVGVALAVVAALAALVTSTHRIVGPAEAEPAGASGAAAAERPLSAPPQLVDDPPTT